MNSADVSPAKKHKVNQSQKLDGAGDDERHEEQTIAMISPSLKKTQHHLSDTSLTEVDLAGDDDGKASLIFTAEGGGGRVMEASVASMAA